MEGVLDIMYFELHSPRSKFDTIIVDLLCVTQNITFRIWQSDLLSPLSPRKCRLSWTKKCATIFNINLMANNNYVNRMYNVILTA